MAGLVSFFSPCVIPLLPGYLSYATGLSGADLESARRGRMLAGSLLFVLGFTAVFVALGSLSGAVGSWLITWQREITVVLGVMTTKTPELESKDTLKRRVEEAAKYVDIDRLCISGQCGFASTVEGNELTIDQEKAKLDLLVETASEIWG